jgi:CHASE1-domain containing sensor protein
VNRLKIRLPAFLVVGLVALIAPVLSGCGAGQIAQTANQEPAVNGNRLTITNGEHRVELRDIRIQASQTRDFIERGQTVDLVFVAINQSPYVADRLVEITSDIGKVEITSDARLQPSGMLFVGAPEGQRAEAPGPIGTSNAAKAVVTLAEPISNGLTYKFNFKFEVAGQGSVMVPISAGPEPQRV